MNECKDISIHSILMLISNQLDGIAGLRTFPALEYMEDKYRRQYEEFKNGDRYMWEVTVETIDLEDIRNE